MTKADTENVRANEGSSDEQGDFRSPWVLEKPYQTVVSVHCCFHKDKVL